MTKSTHYAKPGEVERKWLLIDAEGLTLGRKQGMKLKVYAGPEHPHAAQNPVKIDLEA